MGGDDKQNEAVGDGKGRDGERLREKKEMKKQRMFCLETMSRKASRKKKRRKNALVIIFTTCATDFHFI